MISGGSPTGQIRFFRLLFWDHQELRKKKKKPGETFLPKPYYYNHEEEKICKY